MLVPSVVLHTKSATRLQLTCSRELLGLLIDEKYINIRKCEDQVNNARLALPLELQGVFTPVIEEVGCQTKSKQEEILEKKFDWLERGHSSSRNKEDDSIDGGRRDTVPTARVSVIGDIDVPDSAVETLMYRTAQLRHWLRGLALPLPRPLRKMSYMIDYRRK